MPHQHVAQAGKLGQRVIERHDGTARVAKQYLHALLEEHAAEDLGASQRLRHDAWIPEGTA
jgi:hypothetical protein